MRRAGRLRPRAHSPARCRRRRYSTAGLAIFPGAGRLDHQHLRNPVPARPDQQYERAHFALCHAATGDHGADLQLAGDHRVRLGSIPEPGSELGPDHGSESEIKTAGQSPNNLNNNTIGNNTTSSTTANIGTKFSPKMGVSTNGSTVERTGVSTGVSTDLCTFL